MAKKSFELSIKWKSDDEKGAGHGAGILGRLLAWVRRLVGGATP